MTESHNMPPCPFCGMEVPQDLVDTLYPSGGWWREHPDIGRHYILHADRQDGDHMCWGMHCTQAEGGCGCSVFGHTADEAIANWTRRAPSSLLSLVADVLREIVNEPDRDLQQRPDRYHRAREALGKMY